MKVSYIKGINMFISLLIAIGLYSIPLVSQELPAYYREPFSESFEIRKQQYLQANEYLDNLIESSKEECLKFFQPDFSNIEKYQKSLLPYREKFSKMLGYPPPLIKEEIKPKFVFVAEDSTCKIYRVWVEVLNGMDAYGIYLIPQGLKGKAPLLICEGGAGCCPEAVCDLDTGPPLHKIGREAVKRGYIVWAPMLLVRNAYANEPNDPEANRNVFARKAKLVGTSLDAIHMYKIIKSTEAIIKSRSEIDSKRVGMTGLSLGCYYTLHVMAVFPLIKVGAPSAYFVEQAEFLRNAAIKNPDVSITDNILNTFGFAQIVGLICPRPLLIQLGKNDKTFHTDGALREIEKAEMYYKKLGVGNNFLFSEHNGGHEYEVESILSFIDKYL
jgi:hypothetical protein